MFENLHFDFSNKSFLLILGAYGIVQVLAQDLGIKTGKRKVSEREYSLGNSLTEIGKATLKYLRRDFDLTPNDGIDNVVFYDDDCFLDEEITTYRKIIYKLSKT